MGGILIGLGGVVMGILRSRCERVEWDMDRKGRTKCVCVSVDNGSGGFYDEMCMSNANDKVNPISCW